MSKHKLRRGIKERCHRCGAYGIRLYERKRIYDKKFETKGHVKGVYLAFGWLCVRCEEWITVEHWVREVYGWKKEY